MGENSKRIGEAGEQVVKNFLNQIGWEHLMQNTDIESVDLSFRKKSNGIDGYYHYMSPMISNTIEHVLYSVKYSSKPYTMSQVSRKFKVYYFELTKAIQSFKKSNLKQNTMNRYEDIENDFDRGIIFWLHNSESGEHDLTSQLSNIRHDTSIDHDGIFLVDNRRLEFLSTIINYAKLKYRSCDINFIYFLNGLNNDDKNIRIGKKMPLQYINSNVIPMRVSHDNITKILLFTIDNYDPEDLMKYMGIAHTIACNCQGETEICFPDYKESLHLPFVDNIKNTFDKSEFTKNLIISNYKNNTLK